MSEIATSPMRLASPATRSTLDPADIAAERLRRGAPIVKLDPHGREIYEPDGAVLTKFVTSWASSLCCGFCP